MKGQQRTGARNTEKLTLEPHTGNITLGLALATETGEEDLVVLIDEVQATVIRHCQELVQICF